MRAQEVKEAWGARLRQPLLWAAAGGLMLLPLSIMALLPTTHRGRMLVLILSEMVLFVATLFASPIPWQWTGDGRPWAGWGRGLYQSILAAFLAGLLAAVLPLAFALSPRETGAFIGAAVTFSLLAFFFVVPLGLIITRLEGLGREAEAARAQARQARWMGHRGAFSPRLLSDSLDHMAALSALDARASEQGLVELAALCREWIIEAEKPLIECHQERALVQRYLTLERRRWGADLQVRWRLEPDVECCLMPPLLLIPVLERLLAPGPAAGPLDLELATAGLPARLELSLLAQAAEGAPPCPPPGDELLGSLRRRLGAMPHPGARADLDSLPRGWRLRILIPSPGKGDCP